MLPDQTIERRWHPNPGAFHTDHADNKARHREEAERRKEAEHWEKVKRQAEIAESFRRVASQLERARTDTRAKSKRTASKEGIKADISFPAISRVGGGAALGTVIGTAILPGIGTIAGAVLGGVGGAFAPSALRHGKTQHSENGKPSARP